MNTNVITSKLHFIRNDSNKTPVVNYSGHDESQGYSDDYVFQNTDIHDGRLLYKRTPASLNKEAFKLTTFKPDDVDYSNSDEIKQVYYPSVEALVKQQTGASHVFVFDHTVRRGLKDSNRQPAYHVHNDYTYKTGTARANSVLGEDVVAKFAGKRMIQINVWRSIAGTVERDPLALMDATSLDDNDLVKTDIHFNDMKTGETHHGEIFAAKKNSQQKWAYFPNITSEEAILIKGYDSDSSHSCFAMHTAFALPTQNAESKPRQSIETRTYAFYDE
ncbi:hypothetical protein J3L16_04680 [Alteromonas sp. 5E99-2]|uniref:CmcJ/NvfI family oxidoreductase n=1 Tax=Alteromonas sp. 5E99-2 TaxID=2817683 RepID=UPI001A981F04|nr:CmcJ/NvfI family oxidoreductase [Alteromonas sp. 5E99-2]MBO1254983.1 hypothetical protein [Alteromonas sp. 5E99-2]